MKIGELFVQLGVKGSGATLGALKSTRDGLSDIKSTSFAAKAAILGVAYGMQRLMSNSANVGMGLSNFSSLTGLSAKQLQEWQWAAQQAGVKSEEFTGSLKSVQNAMTNMLMGKGAPEGMGLLSTTVGFDPEKAQDTFYVLEQLQKFAQTDLPKDMANNVMRSFGLSDDVISAMRKNVFTPDTFAQAPAYSDGQIKQLEKVNVAWANLGTKINKAFGDFTAKDGMKMVKDLTMITEKVITLTKSLLNLAKSLKVFQIMGKVFEGLNLITEGITGKTDEMLGNIKEEGVIKGYGKTLVDTWKGAGLAAQGAYYSAAEMVTPSMSPALAGTGGPSSNTTVNQTLNFQHPGTDAQRTAESTNQAARKAFRQSPVQAGGR